ncbi:hypothetical protein MTO96_024278 [Rhipicephalus appendiculatus]
MDYRKAYLLRVAKLLSRHWNFRWIFQLVQSESMCDTTWTAQNGGLKTIGHLNNSVPELALLISRTLLPPRD